MWSRVLKNGTHRGLASVKYHRSQKSSSASATNVTWRSQGDSKDQAVIVLGWAGSRQEHVKKYTDFFAENFKLNSFGAILPMPDLMSYDHAAQDQFARQVLQEVLSSNTDGIKDENQSKKSRLIILSLSNNGATVYPHMVDLCKNKPEFSQKFSIAGAIFDSAPGPLSWPAYMLCGLNLGGHDRLQRIMTPTVSNEKRLFRPIAPMLLNFYIDRMDPSRSLKECLSDANDVRKRLKANWAKYHKEWAWPGDYMLTEKEPWPLHFLYSSKDMMMPSGFIRRVVASQKSLNCRQVLSFDFQTSPHVAHLRYQPDNYKKQFEAFLKLL